MNKITAALLASAVAIGTLAGCSSNGSDPAPADSTAQSAGNKETVTLKFWHRWPESQQALEQMVKEFSEQYPYIRIEMPSIASSQYGAQLQAAAASNDLPDIFANSNAVPVDQLKRLDLIRPIDDAFEGGKKDEFYEGTWTEGFTTLDGSIYALPHFTPRRYAHVLYYNKNVLAKAGLTEQDVPKSWEELQAVGGKIRQSANDVYPLILGIKTDWLATGYIGQMATAIKPEVVPNDGFNLKTGQYEFDSPGYVETIEYLKKLQDDKVLHPNSLVIDYREASSLFAGGKAAFVIDGTFLSSELQQNNKFNEFGVAPLPTKNGNPQYYAFQGETKATIHVSKNTKHYEEIKLFLKFYMDRYYVKQLEMGIEGSPIVEHNQSVKVANPQFVQAQAIQNQTFILSPHPYTRNPAAVQVNTELNGRKPKETVGKILEGYLAGQIKDVKAELAKLSTGYNKGLQESLDKVKQSGGKIDAGDYRFPNWTPFTPYSTDKYKELAP